MSRATPETKASNAMCIKYMCGYFRADPRALLCISSRESGWNHYAEAGMSTIDGRLAKQAWDKRRRKYFEDVGNPFVDEPSLWFASRGLFQMMVPLHLQRWDPVADPRALFHPVVSVITAARLWNRGVKRGLRNMVQIRSMWARGRIDWQDDPDYEKRDRSTRERLQRLGYPASLADKDAREFGYGAFGLEYFEEQYDWLFMFSKNMGITAVPEDMPRQWRFRVGGEDDVDPSIPGTHADDDGPGTKDAGDGPGTKDAGDGPGTKDAGDSGGEDDKKGDGDGDTPWGTGGKKDGSGTKDTGGPSGGDKPGDTPWDIPGDLPGEGDPTTPKAGDDDSKIPGNWIPGHDPNKGTPGGINPWGVFDVFGISPAGQVALLGAGVLGTVALIAILAGAGGGGVAGATARRATR